MFRRRVLAQIEGLVGTSAVGWLSRLTGGIARLSTCLAFLGFAPATSRGNLRAKNKFGDGMNDSTVAAGYLEDFRARGEAIADACTRCGA